MALAGSKAGLYHPGSTKKNLDNLSMEHLIPVSIRQFYTVMSNRAWFGHSSQY
jgi:hypothetical protein